MNLKVGDPGRLEHIKNSLEKNKTLYSSDRNYVENMIKKYSHNLEKITTNNELNKIETITNPLEIDKINQVESDNIRAKYREELRQKEDLDKLNQKEEEKILARAGKSYDDTNEMIELEKLNTDSYDLYNPELIQKIDDSISIRVFYDPIKKQKKYWESTDTIDRIRFRSKEIQDEITIKQNKISLRITTDQGTAKKFAQLISGGNYNFWDHDSSGYYFQAHLSIEEEFLKKIIIKHIRFCYPEMSIYESKLSITSFLPRKKVDYLTASEMLKRITSAACDEINQDMGSIIIEERLRR